MATPAHDGLPGRPPPGEVPVRATKQPRSRRLLVAGGLLAVSSVLVAGHAGGAAIRPRWLRASNPPLEATRGVADEPRPETPATTTTISAVTVAPAVAVTTAAVTASTVWAISVSPTPGGGSTVSSSPTAPARFPRGANAPIPAVAAAAAPPAPAPPWAASVHTTAAGYVTTDLGCARDTSADALDAFFADRRGPVMGMDYQHVYPLDGQRSLWLFQDMFVDQSGAATTLGASAFVHNAAMVQDGACFTLLTRGTTNRPASFEQGTGESVATTWFWPMGGEVVGGRLRVFWAEMHKDATDPGPGNGVGWHPTATWLATYDAGSLARLDFAPAPNAGATPIYGYAVAGDGQFTYLFGNTFEQDLDREGGYGTGPHSATEVFLGRVPEGQLDTAPEYWTPTGWTPDAGEAQPVSSRYWVENPMQPRVLGGEWVAVTKVDGYWGEQLSVDVANQPWGPWTTTEVRGLVPRSGDALMNSYHAHLMPWLDGDGRLVVSYSQNARDMARDAWPRPDRYRPAFTSADLVVPPPDPAADTLPPDMLPPESPPSATGPAVTGSTTGAAPTAGDGSLIPAQRGTTLPPTAPA